MPITPIRTLVLTLALGAGTVGAQEVELYGRPGFQGSRLTLDQATPDLGAYGLAARASSLVVHRGSWEFCTQPGYRGACVTLSPGRYERLPAGLNDALMSLRPARHDGQTRPAPPPPMSGGYGQPLVVLYSGDFGGPELPVNEAVSDLRSRSFNDSAAAIDVRYGQWELCSDGGYAGECLRFGPGRHWLPPALRDRLSSLRPLGYASLLPAPPQPGWGGPHRPWPEASPSIVFHEHANFTGRQLPLVAAAPNFVSLDFNDRASAVEVFRGRWQLCRHIDFQGECVVVGPGRYALGAPMADAVSSARPLSGRGDQPLGMAGAVTLHDQADLRGRTVVVDGPMPNLRDLGFNDRTVAVEVHGGRWELCSRGDFRGQCITLGPGWHRLPPGLALELSSLRPL